MGLFVVLANTTQNGIATKIWMNDAPPKTGLLTPDNGVPGWVIAFPMTSDMTWIGLTGLNGSGNVWTQPGSNPPSSGGVAVGVSPSNSTASDLQATQKRIAAAAAT